MTALSPFYVDPRDVLALKARLHGAFVAMHGVELGPAAASTTPRAHEASALVDAWSEYLSRPVDWLNAPAELEHGLDLEARLAMLQGDGGPFGHARHRAGELLGMHTVGELSDLRDALSYTVGQLTAAYNDCAEQWKAADASSHDAWKADFDQAIQRFGKDWDSADTLIEYLPDWAPIGDETWNAIVSDIHAFTGLDRRIRTAGICTGPTYPNMPQPSHSDIDLKLFNLSGDILSGVKEGAHAAAEALTSPVPWIALGGLLAIVVIAQLRR
jgi:hypothetical protein